MQFEPRAIRFHISMVAVYGGDSFGMETASPELEGEFRLPNGAHGTVSVPLDAGERASLKEIVKSASKRASELAKEVANAAQAQ